MNKISRVATTGALALGIGLSAPLHAQTATTPSHPILGPVGAAAKASQDGLQAYRQGIKEGRTMFGHNTITYNSNHPAIQENNLFKSEQHLNALTEHASTTIANANQCGDGGFRNELRKYSPQNWHSFINMQTRYASEVVDMLLRTKQYDAISKARKEFCDKCAALFADTDGTGNKLSRKFTRGTEDINNKFNQSPLDVTHAVQWSETKRRVIEFLRTVRGFVKDECYKTHWNDVSGF